MLTFCWLEFWVLKGLTRLELWHCESFCFYLLWIFHEPVFLFQFGNTQIFTQTLFSQEFKVRNVYFFAGLNVSMDVGMDMGMYVSMDVSLDLSIGMDVSMDVSMDLSMEHNGWENVFSWHQQISILNFSWTGFFVPIWEHNFWDEQQYLSKILQCLFTFVDS